jgi:nitric oxide reductase NorQ protein
VTQPDPQNIMDTFRIRRQPNYVPQANEIDLFEFTYNDHLPLILKGPTGCGKTRFVEAMAHKMQLPLVTVSCHEDLTAADLVGRFLLKGDDTIWQDGPLTLAVRHGGICYLDEVVEARNDTTVIIHSLTDDRRTLYLDKTEELVRAHDNFMLVMSYNPGYQHVMKDLKQSTKQRFASLVFDHPAMDIETEIIATETGLDREEAQRLAEMGQKIRNLRDFGLEEGVSSRLLVYAGRLMHSGLDPIEACRACIVQSLTDDAEVMASVSDIVNMFYGDTVGEEQPKTNK